MNSVNDLYRSRRGRSPSTCEPQTARCSDCGMLECLCRPRFFAGQILGADDLNRLDGYIRAKTRLHNRQLHGWGVVNGLEVACNPCGGGVSVGCGYALSPCGEDIVVCEAVTVDVCDLIKRCRAAERKTQPCQPNQHPGADGQCGAEEEEWILAIRYAEAPTRGVKPLRPSESGSGCGCSGSGASASTARSSGCGGGGGGGTGKGGCGCSACQGGATATKPRGAPTQCEPTVVCEGFAFEVYRKPVAVVNPDKDRDDLSTPDSELYQRFRCCAQMLFQQIPAAPGAFSLQAVLQDPAAWRKWALQYRAMLLRYFDSHGAYHCGLPSALQLIALPNANDDDAAYAISDAIKTMAKIWLDAILECLCSALLPPCPAPSQDDRVPLAVLHVSGDPCRVDKVCNWSVHRKLALTMPTLQYWLSLLPFGAMLRRMMEQLCCGDLFGEIEYPDDHDDDNNDDGIFDDNVGHPGKPKMATADAAAFANRVEPFPEADQRLNPVLEQPGRIRAIGDVAGRAVERGEKGRPLYFHSLFASALNQREGERLTDAELVNLPQFLLANQILRPLSSLDRDDGDGGNTKPLMALFGDAAPATKARAADADLASLRTELAALRERVEAQDRQLADLKAERAAPAAATPTKPRGSRAGKA